MGRDKKELLANLQVFVKSLYSNPDNKEFAAGIQSIVLNDMRSEPSRDTWSKQISEIYELCLKKNLREQAEDLYKDFPIIEIASGLVDYYIKMESHSKPISLKFYTAAAPEEILRFRSQ